MSTNHTKWTRAYLDRFRNETDPIAEKVIEVIYQENVDHVNQLFHHFTRNRDIDLQALPQAVQDYFIEQAKLPDWLDEDKLKLGEEVYSLYAPEIAMLLFFRSLPATYSCWRGASVLVKTGRMVEHHHSIKMFTARLMETAQFVVDIMRPGAFSSTGGGVMLALKVRLIHAAIRHFIKTKGDWDSEEFGEPINHEDMSGTLLSFSSLILEGLDKQKFGLTEEEKEAYYHSWRVVGHLMGLPIELMPESYSESLALGHTIMDQQGGESEYGKTLTMALVDFINETISVKWLNNILAESLIYYFAGSKTARMIGITRHSMILVFFIWLYQRSYGLIFRLFNRNLDSWIVKKLSKFNRHLLSKIILKFNENKQIAFDLPPSLSRN